jgi:hypothetical protein
MMKKLLIGLALCSALAFPAAAQERPNQGRDLMRELGQGGLEGNALAQAIAKAENQPLGSRANPVRENMPAGEVAYLRRLRCSDGRAPAHERVGNIGPGVYGNIIDHYKVTCQGAPPTEVYMDMYHDGPENRPIPGFTIAPAASPQV